MSRPVQKIIAEIKAKGLEGSEYAVSERFSHLTDAELLAAIMEKSSDAIVHSRRAEEDLETVECLTAILAIRIDPEIHRQALALYDPSFTFDRPLPIAV